MPRNRIRCASAGHRYPPTLDAELDGADAGLSTLKTQSLEGVEGGAEGEGKPDGEEEEEEEHRVLPSTKEERREAKKKLKEEEKKLKVLLVIVWMKFTFSKKPSSVLWRLSQLDSAFPSFHARDNVFSPAS